jgi:hypothetical protein
MKKIIVSLLLAVVVAAGVFGLFVYRKATPSSADHQLLTLAAGTETVSAVTLNLRLLKSARSVASLKDRVESSEKYLLKAGGIAPRHRDLFLETFSSVSSGSMKLPQGTAPFRLFATHGSADQGLEALKGAHLVEATTGEDFVLIDPETCEREVPLRLVKGKGVLAFVPAALADGVAARLAQAPGQQMDSLLIAKVGVNVRPYVEELAHPFVQMIATQMELTEKVRSLDVALRADKSGGVWAELDVATDHADVLRKLWEEKTGGESPVRGAVEEAVKLAAVQEGLRVTFDVNALQKHAQPLTALMSPSQREPLKAEDLEAITEEEVLEAADVFSYGEPLTAESFFARSGEECDSLDGMPLSDDKKLSLAFESLSADLNLPGADFVRLSAHACLPPHYVPHLGQRKLLEVAIQNPVPARQSCGPLAAEADGMTSKERFDSSRFSNEHKAENVVRFAFAPGVDTQKLAAIEGTVTVNIPTRVKKLQVDFAPPYKKTELALPEGRLYVEGITARSDGLAFTLVGEGAHPTVLDVRALNAEGKHLKTEVHRSSAGGFFNLPFQDLLPESRDVSVFASGKPARLEVVVVEATTPLTRPFTLKPPFPTPKDSDEEEDAQGEPQPAAAFSQATYEQTFLAPERAARNEAALAQYLESSMGNNVGSGLRTDSPFIIALRTEGIFEGNLAILWPEDVGAGFKQMDTPLDLEIQEVDFVDGTQLRPADIEAFEGDGQDKQYVWGDQGGRQVTWRTKLSLQQSNGGYNDLTLLLFDDYRPHRLEEVPVARVKGQLSFSLPESVVMSSPVPLSLHSRAEAGKDRFRVVSIQQGSVSVLSENTGEAGYSTLFTDAAGRPLEASLKKRTDFEDGTFRLDFGTEGAPSRWQMLQARGATKTYTYPFEMVAYELKPKRTSRHAKRE